ERARRIALDALREGVPADSPSPLMAHQALAMAEGYLGSWERGIALLDEWPAAAPSVDPYFVSGYHGSKAAMLATSGNSIEAGVDEVTRRQDAFESAKKALDASTFSVVHSAGMAMTRDDVIEFALAKLDELIAEAPVDA